MLQKGWDSHVNLILRQELFQIYQVLMNNKVVIQIRVWFVFMELLTAEGSVWKTSIKNVLPVMNVPLFQMVVFMVIVRLSEKSSIDHVQIILNAKEMVNLITFAILFPRDANLIYFQRILDVFWQNSALYILTKTLQTRLDVWTLSHYSNMMLLTTLPTKLLASQVLPFLKRIIISPSWVQKMVFWEDF